MVNGIRMAAANKPNPRNRYLNDLRQSETPTLAPLDARNLTRGRNRSAPFKAPYGVSM